jgi:hypothetical protein
MRRFDYDENDRDDIDNFFNEPDPILTPEEYKKIAEEDQAIQYAQIGMVHRELNRKLLSRAITMCEKSFFWKFLSLNSQLNHIDLAYKKFKKLEEE